MPVDLGFTCRCCGQHHSELPLSFAAPAPDYWTPELADDPGSFLTSDLCAIKNEAFFAHGLIELPILGTDDVFSWGVWVSLSLQSFERMGQMWEAPGRESEPAYFGWLSTQLAIYSPTTINLKTKLHTRPVGQRPTIELEPTDHPLAVEQRAGITPNRVRELAERLLHP